MGFAVALGKFILNAKRSHPDKLAKTQPASGHEAISLRLAAIQAIGGTAEPVTAKHPVNWLPAQCEDQGQTEACTAHALSQGMCATCGAQGIDIGFQGPPSPLFFYTCSGAIARANATPVGAPAAEADDGRELADNITALMTCGMVAMGTASQCPTPDGRFSDLWSTVDVGGLANPPPANVANEPSIEAIEAAKNDCLSGAYTVALTDANSGDVCAAALDSGIALYVGFDCGNAFQNLGPNDIAQPTAANDGNQGGHAVILVSWRLNASGQREWLLRNSWSGGWAMGGSVWCSDAFRLALWEMWLLSESLIPVKAAA